jgi:acetyltransferase-like isoleucine patch superfamily enzyme
MTPRSPSMSRRAYLRRMLRLRAARAGNRLRAKWYLRHAKSVGRNAIVRGRPLITNRNLYIGDNVKIISTHRRTHFTGDGRIEIGTNTIINSGTTLISTERITIGEHVAISIEVMISDSNLHPIGMEPIYTKPVELGNGSWLGLRAIVMPGVKIGSRSVVAAGSIVTRDVPDDTLVAGVPARIVRKLEYAPGALSAHHRHHDLRSPDDSVQREEQADL